MKRPASLRTLVFFVVTVACLAPLRAQRQVEALGRGVVAVRSSATDTFVSWRLLGTDSAEVTFNLYRSANAGTAVLIHSTPVAGATNFTDTTADPAQTNTYYVRPIVAGVEQPPSSAFTVAAGAAAQPFLRVPLQRPANGVTPTGEGYSYNANDMSAGDLDGDGEYELVLKWDPSNARDSSQDGYTGITYLDAYKLDGTRLWRIDLGVNIRAGAHDTPFIVYDFDGDGRAEIAMRTAPGTMDGLGNFIADPAKFAGPFPSEAFSHSTDYRNSAGRALIGPEFLTVFDGLTGAERASTKFLPARHPDTDFPTSAQLFDVWGDTSGNRQGRFYPPGVAYLDGTRPSIVMGRGYASGQSGHPGRVAVASWNFRDGALTPLWHFDSRGHAQERSIAGSGAHNASVADLDGDGKDDIVYGQVWVRSDGTLIPRATWGHGDALHVTNMDPDRAGQQVFMPHESPGAYGPNAVSYEDGLTSQLVFGVQATGDIGRGVAADVDPRFRGYEMWASGATGGMYTAQRSTADASLGGRGTQVAAAKPGSINHAVWWDGDLLRELLDGTTISKWNWTTETTAALLSTSGLSSNNGTKSNPCLQADLLGDWREEVIWRESSNEAIRIYTTTIPTTQRLYTLMHDTQYRVAIAWQNVGYNQPPHPSFFLGDGMNAAPTPSIRTVAAAPRFTAPPAAQSASPGESVTLTAAVSGASSYRWQRNGADVSNANASSLTIAALAPANTGLYTTIAANPGASATSSPAIVGLNTADKVTGDGTQVGFDIKHANGNVFDQVLLQGPAATIKADFSAEPGFNQITRMSFVDLSNDIVQIEYSGPGSVSVVLADPSPPARPVNYAQEVDYVKGHAGIVVTGATESSHLSVFSVGRGNAVNAALFKDTVDYDGFADIAFVAIHSADGKFGGLRTANASYVATTGFTGVYAPGVQFTGPVFVGDINASDTATPVLIIGSALGVTGITGGDLQQANNRPIQTSGLVQLRFMDGSTSHYVVAAPNPAEYLLAQTNKGRLEQEGVDVTAQIVVNP